MHSIHPHFCVSLKHTDLLAPQKNVIVKLKGFIANKQDLIQMLKLSNSSDEGIFKAAYKKWSEDFQKFVFGEYFVVIIDYELSRLVATRDGLGMRPGYYSFQNSQLIIGSNLEQVSNNFESNNLHLSDNYISEFLIQGVGLSGATIYKEIELLPASKMLVFDGKLTFRTGWSLLNSPTLTKDELSSVEELFCQHLEKAISCSIDDTPPIVELSGGMDSSTILSMTSVISKHPPKAAISYVYSESKSADEREWIELVLEQYPTEWITLDEDKLMPFSSFPSIAPPEPTRLLTMWQSYTAYCEAIKTQQTSIVLSGFGGDQVLGGDISIPIFAAENLMAPRMVFQRLQEWQKERGKVRPLSFYFMQGVFNPIKQWKSGNTITGILSKDTVPWITPKLLDKNPWGLCYPSSPLKAESVTDQFYWESIWRISYSVTQFWNQLDLPFEIRHPLLYRPLVELMFRLPWRFKLSGEQDRVLQRRSLKNVLPNKISGRSDKKGPDEAFRRGLSNSSFLMNELHNNSIAVDLGYIAPDPWRRALKKTEVGLAPPQGQFTNAVILELWLRLREGEKI